MQTTLTPRLKKLLIATFALALSSGCSSKKPVAFVVTDGPRISKGTKTQAAAATETDEFMIAFNEILWSRQVSSLAINPPSLSSKEGCVIHKPLKGAHFLVDVYDCRRESDYSDMALSNRHELLGNLYYSINRGFYDLSGTFSSHIYSLKTPLNPETLISQGSLTRSIQIVAPTGVLGAEDTDSSVLKTTVYKESSITNYAGDVAQESKRLPETWQARFVGGVTVTSAVPLTMIAGSGLVFSYTPEAEEGAKRQAQTIEFTATSDVSFVSNGVSNGSCLRPVGSFNWTIGVGSAAKSGTLTASVAGYKRSDEPSLRAWGKRCLER